MVRVKPRGRPSLDEDSDEADGYEDFGVYDFEDADGAAAAQDEETGHVDDSRYLQALQSSLEGLQQQHEEGDEGQQAAQQSVEGLLEPSLQAWAHRQYEDPSQPQHEQQQHHQQQDNHQIQEQQWGQQQQQQQQELHLAEEPAAPTQQQQQHYDSLGDLPSNGNAAFAGRSARQAAAAGVEALPAGRKRSRKQSRPFSAAAAAAAGGGGADAGEHAGKRTRGAGGVDYNEQAWDWASEEQDESEDDQPGDFEGGGGLEGGSGRADWVWGE